MCCNLLDINRAYFGNYNKQYIIIRLNAHPFPPPPTFKIKNHKENISCFSYYRFNVHYKYNETSFV